MFFAEMPEALLAKRVPSGKISALPAPLIFRSPATSSLAAGASVPIPTFKPSSKSCEDAVEERLLNLASILGIPLAIFPALVSVAPFDEEPARLSRAVRGDEAEELLAVEVARMNSLMECPAKVSALAALKA